ncbi:MAG: SigE family RNA polymerase sigma factor [Actinomycetota bacterium]
MIATREGVRAVPDAARPLGGRSSAGGDPAAWDADTAVANLYAAHWRPLVRLAALLTGETSWAEEVVADAFVALHRRWPRLHDPQAAFGYLRASVVNGSRSVRRHRDVEVRRRLPGAPAPAGPEERALRTDEDARVVLALRRLPRRQQEVLVLRYYEDATEAEIAEALGISRGAVKSHAHRGMSALRAALTEEGLL